MLRKISGLINTGFSFGRIRLVAIVGAPRSGSTLLIRLLNAHSKIAAPCEIGLPEVFPAQDEKYLIVTEKWGRICAYYGVDPARSKNNPFLLFRAILRREGKRRLVLKDPRASLYLDALDRYRPRYVHLIRDARSVASSRMFSEPRAGFRTWLAYHSAALSFFRRSRRDPIKLRYEDLVAAPERELSALLNRLELAFEPAMLRFGDFRHADDEMRLWVGEAPGSSRLQHDLGLSIRPPQDAPSWAPPVIAAYDGLPEVKDLNESFGYR